MATKKGHCSWCFHLTEHEIVEKSMISRHVCRCTRCTRRTLVCRVPTCGDMARGTATMDEELCFVHKKVLKSWEDKDGMNELRKEAWCSRCMKFGVQEAVSVGVTGTSFECVLCKHPTLPCPSCTEAFMAAKGATTCAKCSGAIASWGDSSENQAVISREGWCSWCAQYSLHERKHADADTWKCSLCYNQTIPCKACGETAHVMACVHKVSAPKCMKCTMEKEGKRSWGDFVEESERVDSEALQEDYIRDVLSRDHPRKTEARDTGMIRPLLALASMHPKQRTQLGALLQIAFDVSKMNDPYEQAWQIINDGRSSIRFRTSSTLETLNVVGGGQTWYETVVRTLKTTFAVTDLEAASPAEISESSVTPYHPLMLQAESRLLRQTAGMLKAQLPEAVVALAQRMGELGVDVEVSRALSGLEDRDTLVQYVLQLAVIAAGVDPSQDVSDDELRLIDVSAGIQYHPAKKSGALRTAKKIAKNIGVKKAVGMALPVIGQLLLVKNITEAAFGSKEDSLVEPLKMILTHMVYLRLRKCSVDEYMTN